MVFNACINDGIVAFGDARSCFEALRPVRRVADAADAFLEAHVEDAPFIGLHVRHGNGGDIMGHAFSWQAFGTAMMRIRRAVDVARERLGKQALVLLCTDSSDVQSEITRTIPGVICRPKPYRPPGHGELHHGPDAAARLDDALIEMVLLARCNALVRYPAASFFSLYAAVMKPTEDPHPVDLLSLARPSNSQDRLSPAVLF
ncbi:hypothetical protein J3R73_001799 [Labrys monachus]|uniref:GT23 domain-containing protein n=1 Tax=Labrys monachus TaxID=217067 RepID=A0ABU0FBL8_9HYPH|nr:hypothetical protein [Labrys monachus]